MNLKTFSQSHIAGIAHEVIALGSVARTAEIKEILVIENS